MDDCHTGLPMLTRTEGLLPSKSSNQMRTNQSAMFVICLNRGDWVGDRHPSEFHWKCKQLTRNFGDVDFTSERWEEMFVKCFLDRDEKFADVRSYAMQKLPLVLQTFLEPRICHLGFSPAWERSLIEVSQLNTFPLTYSSQLLLDPMKPPRYLDPVVILK
jgi:hypothetical protein